MTELTNDGEFPETPPGRPLWLITLADLALLLVGFFVLVQATQHLDSPTLARGFRQGFGGAPAAVRTDPIPLAAVGMMNFTPGSAMLPSSPDALTAWAREAVRDPRVVLKVTGSVDGSAADVDPETGSGAVLAIDRARSVAAALAEARAVTPGKMTIATALDSHRTGRRAVIVTLGFAGQP